jgi:hypothetical protein
MNFLMAKTVLPALDHFAVAEATAIESRSD